MKQETADASLFDYQSVEGDPVQGLFETDPEVLSKKFTTIKGIYFDLDDTLCGYWHAVSRGLEAAFEEQPVNDLSTKEIIDVWAAKFREFSKEVKEQNWYKQYLEQGGITRTELMRLVLLSQGIDDAERAEALSASYAKHRNANLKLFPEAEAMLEKLHGKFPLGLITNGPADIQREEIETLGIGKYFDHVFIEGEQGIGKPSPKVFFKAEEAMGLAGEELLFVGNSYEHDILPAIQAFWRTVWVRRDTDVPPSSERTGPKPIQKHCPFPDAVIDDLGTLLKLLRVE